ncbi:MAG: hypothetical protein R2698_05445 [Microthrixaceae bacterium]
MGHALADNRIPVSPSNALVDLRVRPIAKCPSRRPMAKWYVTVAEAIRFDHTAAGGQGGSP